MIDARSGTALGGLFLVLAVVSELLARVGRRRHGAIYLGGSSVVAVAGLLLVTVHGVQASGADALRAAILYGVYGAGSLALTARWRRLGLSYLGLVLVATSALWAMWSAGYHVGPPWGAVLAIEGLVMVAAAAVLDRYATGAWHDPWKMFGEDGNHQLAVSMPRSKGLSLADIFRIPLIHVGEAATMLAAAACDMDRLERPGDYSRRPDGRADCRQRGNRRGLFPPGVALSLARADVGRLVGRAGRRDPRPELQLFPVPRSARPQLDDRLAGPCHVGPAWPCRVWTGLRKTSRGA